MYAAALRGSSRHVVHVLFNPASRSPSFSRPRIQTLSVQCVCVRPRTSSSSIQALRRRRSVPTDAQESDRREALSSCMVPYVHYVPLKPDVSDLEEQITWALANETRLRQIAEAGAELVISHFSSVIERYRMSMAISVSSLADNVTTSVAVSM
eukprot:4072824-Pleurochrysis_carterae.AAC.3